MKVLADYALGIIDIIPSATGAKAVRKLQSVKCNLDQFPQSITELYLAAASSKGKMDDVDICCYKEIINQIQEASKAASEQEILEQLDIAIPMLNAIPCNTHFKLSLTDGLAKLKSTVDLGVLQFEKEIEKILGPLRDALLQKQREQVSLTHSIQKVTTSERKEQNVRFVDPLAHEQHKLHDTLKLIN